MNAKLQNTAQPWVDPDDAPALTDEFFKQGIWKIGEHTVTRKEGQAAMRVALRRGRPKAETRKLALTVRYDADVIAAFRATGAGWQTRMNEALREWLRTHSHA